MFSFSDSRKRHTASFKTHGSLYQRAGGQDNLSVAFEGWLEWLAFANPPCVTGSPPKVSYVGSKGVLLHKYGRGLRSSCAPVL